MSFKKEYLNRILGFDSKNMVKKPKTIVSKSGSVDMLVAGIYASNNLSLAKNPVQSALVRSYNDGVRLGGLVRNNLDNYSRRNFY